MNNLHFAIFETYALFFIQLTLLGAGVLIITWPRTARTGLSRAKRAFQVQAVEVKGVGGLKIAVAIALTPAVLHTLGF